MVSLSSVLVILSLLGAAQGVLFGLALLNIKRGNRIANRLLSALIFVFSIFLFGAIMRTTGYDLILPHLSRIHDPFTFLVSPLLFLYLKVLTGKNVSFSKKNYLHFIPFGVCVVYLIPYYFQSAGSKIEILLGEHQQAGLGDWYYVRSAIIIVYSLIYLFLSVFMLAAYFRRIRQEDIQPNKSVLLQIRFLITAVLTIWIVGVLRYTLDHTSQTNLLVPLLAAITIYGLGYIWLRNPEMLSGDKQLLPSPIKYENSTLSADKSERYLKRVRQIMETEKPYLDGELTLQKLANNLSISPAHLSQIINERLNQSFSDFVNTYRVEEVKKMFLDPAKKHYSILAIAEEAGFNSKSSFNSVFKKFTNVTPSEFRKSQNANREH
jgi:AraC-like DNA-binding protein